MVALFQSATSTAAPRIRPLVSAALTVALLVILLRRVPIGDAAAVAASARPGYLALSAALAIASNFLLSPFRWWLLLSFLHAPTTFKDAFLMKAGSAPLSTLLPARADDLSLLVYLRRQNEIPIAASTTAVLGAHLLSIEALLLCLVAGLSLRWAGGQLAAASWIVLSLTGAAVLASARKSSRAQPSPDWRRVPGELLRLACDPFLLLVSLALVGAELAAVYSLSAALATILPLDAFLIGMPFVIIPSAAHLTLGGIGLREALVMTIFASHATPERLLALGGLYSAVDHLLPALLGALVSGPFLRRLV